MTRSHGRRTPTWWRNRAEAVAVAWLAPLLACLCGGCCGGGVRGLVAQLPHVDGRWTGRVVPVEVNIDGAVTYQAAALELTGGTPFERTLGPVWPELGGGRRPLLVTDETDPHILDPSAFDAGAVYEVTGVMLLRPVSSPRGGAWHNDVTVTRAARQDPSSSEHVIVVCGATKKVGK